MIRDGKIDQQELKNLRFSVDDLTEQLRAAGYFDLNEVQFAIVGDHRLPFHLPQIYRPPRHRPGTWG